MRKDGLPVGSGGEPGEIRREMNCGVECGRGRAWARNQSRTVRIESAAISREEQSGAKSAETGAHGT